MERNQRHPLEETFQSPQATGLNLADLRHEGADIGLRAQHLEMPIWSAGNVQNILQEVPARWKVLFWCIALTGVRAGELLALQWKDIDWDAKTITFGKGFWRGRLQDSSKTGQEHVRHMPGSLERILATHLEGSKNIGTDDFVFCRSDDDLLAHMTQTI